MNLQAITAIFKLTCAAAPQPQQKLLENPAPLTMNVLATIATSVVTALFFPYEAPANPLKIVVFSYLVILMKMIMVN